MPRRTLSLPLGLCAALLVAWSASAGPVADFEADLRAAYADYRSALFFTNAGKPAEAERAVDDFRQQWTALSTAYGDAPPQYEDDPAYAETIAAVSEIAGHASDQIASGDLAEAHETLEAIRDEIGALRGRNGVIGFSDRMNAYHAEMEEVLGRDYDAFDAEGIARLREEAAVLAYLANEVAANPPAEAPGNEAFQQALDAFLASVKALQAAARSGDPAAAKQAIARLKGPYSKLFLQFG